MKRGSLGVRSVLVLVGLPVFFVLIYLLPHYRHLGLNIAVVAVTAVGALEMEGLLAAKGGRRLRALALLSALLPATAYLIVFGLLRPEWFEFVLVGLLSASLLSLLGARRDQDLLPLLHQAAGSVLILVYPALFLTFIVRITGLPNASPALLFFFGLNIGNDMMAYLIGTFLGSGTRFGYPVSPNKSILGFAAGLVASVGIAVAVRGVFPSLFPVSYPAAAVFGFGTGVLVIAGDLVESAFKRSAEVKDSGGAIPGRGGILDSVDSWLLSAPLFYFVFRGISGYIAR